MFFGGKIEVKEVKSIFDNPYFRPDKNKNFFQKTQKKERLPRPFFLLTN